ncbi:MAG TPA: FAD-dependent oxidoreductase [Tepidisphaeraceae bacterium]|nr:FAD-dependent oxidoreductase [Tepidisphaeraceae bacterium]
MTCDYLVVGSGLSGATIARHLSDAGCRVQVLERRANLGGNVADVRHESGIYIGQHGPHYFRTSSDQVWQFINRFSEFHPYSAVVKSKVDGKLENWPIAASYIRRTIGRTWQPQYTGIPNNFEEAALSLMPRAIYEKFVKGYTEKQWGMPAQQLAAHLCRRFDVRADDNPHLTPRAKYQAIPTGGYTAMMQRMLNGIPVELSVDYLADRRAIRPRFLTIYSGPIDQYFNYSLGRLQYRGQKRETSYAPNTEWAQPCGQVNYPAVSEGSKLRTIEWKHMMRADLSAKTRGTVLTTETPYTPTNADEYEYPIPDDANEELYLEYQRLASQEAGTLFCGRLGEYRYYDMDQAIGRAMMLAQRILTKTLAEAA